jgi:hypothetical protein
MTCRDPSSGLVVELAERWIPWTSHGMTRTG